MRKLRKYLSYPFLFIAIAFLGIAFMFDFDNENQTFGEWIDDRLSGIDK